MKHEDKVGAFRGELEQIPDPRIRRWVEDCLCLSPDYFFEVGASDSNMHHPYWDLGPGGTVRHTRAVFKVVMDLSGSILVPEDKDKAKNHLEKSRLGAAAILHDSCKYGLNFDLRLYELHPYLPRALFGKINTIDAEDKEWIFRAIESHMGSYANGSWSLIPYTTCHNLRQDVLMHALHQADYIVSRSDYIDPRFKDVNKDIDTSSLPHFEPFPDNILRGLIIGVMLEEMDEDELKKRMGEGMVDDLLRRVSSLRTPYSKRKRDYNLDGVLRCVRENLSKFLGG